jgi:imidazole glycerol-phosphate synthase subunit HisH
VKDVVIVDYGAGNTHSVAAALRRLESRSVVSSDPATLLGADYVVLPGVGSARSAMEHLRETGAAAALVERTHASGPVLGICLGLQLALESSEEDGGVTGLGLIDGTVTRLREGRVPRLGWEIVEPWGEAFYFAHSYAANTPYATASADGVTAVVEHGAFLGVQFHPEKSGPAGLDFLSSCLSRA